VALPGVTVTHEASSVAENGTAEPSLIVTSTVCGAAASPGATANDSDAGAASSAAP
jgi:hypothetical protein